MTTMKSWNSVDLGSVVQLINGDRGKNYPSQKDFINDGIPFINAGHIQEGSIQFKSMNYISQETFNLLGSGKILPNDILYCLRGSLGKTAIVQDIDKGAIASSLVIIRPSKDITIKYLYYFLTSYLGQAEIYKHDNGSAQPNLSAASVKAYKIPLPPLEEQKRIAAILDKADRIRRKRQEAIRLTEELGRSIFLDMFGDPVTNPKGWEIKKLRSVIQSIDAGWSANAEERKCKEDDWGVLKVSAVTSGKFKPFENKSVGENPNFPKPPIIPKKGDLLFSRANTRELVAATCLVEQDYERIFLSDKLWRISILKGLITPEYLKFLLTYQRYRDLLTKKATGTSGSMLNISQGKLLDMDAPIPDIDIQRKFSDLIWKSIEVSTRIRENNKESENLFNSLLQRAFRGEL